MKIYLIIICVLLSLKISSQDKKIEFLNEDYQEIEKTEFIEKNKTGNYLDLYFENDSLIQCLLVRRKSIGRLKKKKFETLKKNLSIQESLENKLIVIIYYPGKDRCNQTEKNSTWNIFNGDYLRKLKKISDISHHWIYKSDENLKYYRKNKREWKKDLNGFIEKTFFQYHFPCFSCVVIDSNGNFIKYNGEFGKQHVWEISEELKNIEKT